MECLEQQAIPTARIDCKPKLWKRYVDNILQAIKTGKVEVLNSQTGLTKRRVSNSHMTKGGRPTPIPGLTHHWREDGTINHIVHRKAKETD